MLWADLRTAPLCPVAEGTCTSENMKAWERRLRHAGHHKPICTPPPHPKHIPLGPEPTHWWFQSAKQCLSAQNTAPACPTSLNNRAISEGEQRPSEPLQFPESLQLIIHSFPTSLCWAQSYFLKSLRPCHEQLRTQVYRSRPNPSSDTHDPMGLLPRRLPSNSLNHNTQTVLELRPNPGSNKGVCWGGSGGGGAAELSFI